MRCYEEFWAEKKISATGRSKWRVPTASTLVRDEMRYDMACSPNTQKRLEHGTRLETSDRVIGK